MDSSIKLDYLIHHLAAVLGKQSDQTLLEQLGIGLSQYKILMVLERNPDISQKAIADALGQTEASISRQIKLLKNKGLLSSRIDSNNKRRHIAVPSSLGVQLTEAASQILSRNFNNDLAAVDTERLNHLSEELEKLHSYICQPGKVGACDHQLGF